MFFKLSFHANNPRAGAISQMTFTRAALRINHQANYLLQLRPRDQARLQMQVSRGPDGETRISTSSSMIVKAMR